MDYLNELIKASIHGKHGKDELFSQQYKGYSLFSINTGYPALFVLRLKSGKVKDLSVKGKIVKGKLMNPRRINWLYVNTTNNTCKVNFDSKNKTITLVDDFADAYNIFPPFKKGTVFEFGDGYLKRVK